MNPDLPNLSPSDIATALSRVAQEEDFSVSELTDVLNNLPVGDTEEGTYLESACRCILEVSNLVDQKYSDLSTDKKVACKFRLMSKLLSLKSIQLG